MSRRLPLLLAALPALALLSSCSSDNPTTPGPSTVVIDEAVIGPGGGDLSGDEIVLTIPPGALASDTDLAILEADADHPLAPSELRTYHLTGLPEDLAAPLSLRLWHGGDAADSARVCLAEMRDSRSGGRAWTWSAAATRDSAGWSIATLTEGPHGLPDKAGEDLQATVIREVRYMTSDDGHFAAGYPYPAMSDADTRTLLDALETAYQEIRDLGFRFGDQDTAWPRPVFCMQPEDAVARYVSGPCGQGQFAIPPGVESSAWLDMIAAHEVFHCAQDYFDTRPCSQWAEPNAARRWLDEAASSWIETRVAAPELAWPLSTTSDNYFSAFYGLQPGADTSDLDVQNQYGYAMSSFIGYLVQTQGEGRVLELFQQFAATGSAAQAIMAIADPPLTTWCADFHRHLYMQDIFAGPGWDIAVDYYEYLDLDGGVGDQARQTFEVADFGAQAVKIDLGAGQEYLADELFLQVGAGAELSVFLDDAGEAELYDVTTDSLSLTGLNQILDDDVDIVALLSWPEGTAPEYDEWNDVELFAELRGDPVVEPDGFDNRPRGSGAALHLERRDGHRRDDGRRGERRMARAPGLVLRQQQLHG